MLVSTLITANSLDVIPELSSSWALHSSDVFSSSPFNGGSLGGRLLMFSRPKSDLQSIFCDFTITIWWVFGTFTWLIHLIRLEFKLRYQTLMSWSFIALILNDTFLLKGYEPEISSIEWPLIKSQVITPSDPSRMCDLACAWSEGPRQLVYLPAETA